MVELNSQFSRASVLQVRVLTPMNGIGALLCGAVAVRGSYEGRCEAAFHFGEAIQNI
jgi:hypothetical protein